MKLRFTTDKIRIRLNQSDIDTIKDQGMVEIIVRLGLDVLDVFKTSVILSESLTPTIKMLNKHIRVYLPAASICNWSDKQEVILAYEMEFSNTNILTLLIEFDKPCFHKEQVNE
ncbi:MAG: hypothetical protein IPH93_09720 [Saprospiraceae bacterium]|nr:hypothetical protein [Saprospiraceae bacterium]